MPLLDDACASVPTSGGLAISLGSINPRPSPAGGRPANGAKARGRAIDSVLHILRSCFTKGASP